MEKVSTSKVADRRLSPRRITAAKVLVTDERLGLTRCTLRDISLEGAFVETGNIAFSKNAAVELVVRYRSGKKRGHCRVAAKVLRVSQNGAALVFNDVDERVYRALFALVYPS